MPKRKNIFVVSAYIPTFQMLIHSRRSANGALAPYIFITSAPILYNYNIYSNYSYSSDHFSSNEECNSTLCSNDNFILNISKDRVVISLILVYSKILHALGPY